METPDSSDPYNLKMTGFSRKSEVLVMGDDGLLHRVPKDTPIVTPNGILIEPRTHFISSDYNDCVGSNEAWRKPEKV